MSSCTLVKANVHEPKLTTLVRRYMYTPFAWTVYTPRRTKKKKADELKNEANSNRKGALGIGGWKMGGGTERAIIMAEM